MKVETQKKGTIEKLEIDIFTRFFSLLLSVPLLDSLVAETDSRQFLLVLGLHLLLIIYVESSEVELLHLQCRQFCFFAEKIGWLRPSFLRRIPVESLVWGLVRDCRCPSS